MVPGRTKNVREKMKKLIIAATFLALLLTGCVQQRPLDIGVSVAGQANTFHTDFAKGNNSVNVTITQRPSELIAYSGGKKYDSPNIQTSLKCYDEDDYLITGKVTFAADLSELYFTGQTVETRIDDRIVITHPEIEGFVRFLPRSYFQNYNFSKLGDNFFKCKFSAKANLNYAYYVDGVLIKNDSILCYRGLFKEFYGYLNIICTNTGGGHSDCKYAYFDVDPSYQEELQNFLEYNRILDEVNSCYNSDQIIRR